MSLKLLDFISILSNENYVSYHIRGWIFNIIFGILVLALHRKFHSSSWSLETFNFCKSLKFWMFFVIDDTIIGAKSQILAISNGKLEPYLANKSILHTVCLICTWSVSSYVVDMQSTAVDIRNTHSLQ